MAAITINIPDAQVARVLEAFTEPFGWTPELGVTKAAFAKQQLAAYVREVTLSFERQKKMAAIADTALDVT